MATKKLGSEVLKSVSEFLRTTKGFDRVLNQVTITGGGDGKCEAKFTVEDQHLNRMGGLHGGFTATIVDCITTYALITAEKPLGVSVDIHVSYLTGARKGDTVLVKASTIRAGKTLAFLECELLNEKNGAIIAKGTQTKFIAV